jgi:predicted metal-dependent peptidase
MSDLKRIGIPTPIDWDQVDPNLSKMVEQAKLRAASSYPFLGYMLAMTKVVVSEDIPTAAAWVSGGRLYVGFSPEAMSGENPLITNKQQGMFVLLHEMMHNYYMHQATAKEQNLHPKLWNVATDYFINGMLDNIANNSGYMEMPEVGLLDHKYDGMASIEIYHKLLEEADNDPEQAVANATGGNGGDTLEDVIIDSIENNHGELSDSEKQEIREILSSAVDQASQKEIGSGLGDFINSIKEMTTPTVNWKEELTAVATSTVRDNYTFKKPNPLSNNGRIVFPSMDGEHINLLFGFDSSGSMDRDDFMDVAAQIYSICEDFDSWEVTLGSCDVEFEEIDFYSSEDGDDFSNMNINFRGGGGTEMSPIIKHADDMEEEPDAVIIVTDGVIPEEPVNEALQNCPSEVIFVVTRRGNKNLNLDCKVIQIND